MTRYALAGFMGVGKTTVGRRLAERTGLPFVDLDAELVARFGPIAAQFARDGEAVFRAREKALALAWCADAEPRVLATGGGTWVDPETRRALRASYRAVVLDAPLAVVRDRVGGDPGRPLSAELAARYEARRVAYADADLIVDATLPVERVVERILEHTWT